MEAEPPLRTDARLGQKNFSSKFGHYSYFTWSDTPLARGDQRYTAMRVIGGRYRGRPLRSLRGVEIRPTSDRLRETLFNDVTRRQSRGAGGNGVARSFCSGHRRGGD